MTSYYVRSSGGSDSNDGLSHATAWATIQHAINTMTTGQANRLNLSGTFTLSASLDFATRPYSPNQDNWLKLQGYSTVEGDGGIARINGGGNEIINDDNLDSIHIQHCKFTNWGSGTAFSLDNYCNFAENEFDGEGARTAVIDADNGLTFVCNLVHGIALDGVCVWAPNEGNLVAFNYIQIDSATTGDQVIRLGVSSSAFGNIVNILGWNTGCTALLVAGDFCRVFSNTLVNQDGINSIGIAADNAGNEGLLVFNNLLKDFATGISSPTGSQMDIYGFNKFHGCTVNESLSGGIAINLGNNDTLASSPFTSLGNANHYEDDFSVSSDLDDSAYPVQMYDPDGIFGARNQTHLIVGALQRASGGGGSTLIVVDDE